MKQTKAVTGSEFSSYHEALKEGVTSCERTLRSELANVSRYDKRLSAFVTLFDGEHGAALARARELDAGLREGKARDPSGLFGVSLAIKDNIFVGGFRTTSATFHFRDFVPSVNANVVDDALAAGGIPLGKTNLHELALGGTSAASFFGPVRNPYDQERVAGGSSGGSAVAVALSKGPVLGLGTDTGGSVRVPAAFCGIVGFKPTLGTLSLGGVFPLSATLDHAGLLTRTVPDMELAFEALTGRRPLGAGDGKKVRVGALTGYYLDETDEEVARDFWRALERMEGSERFSVAEVPTTPDFERFMRARAVIQLKEAAWFYEELVRSRDTSAKMNPDVVTLLKRGLGFGQVRYLEASLARLESIRVFEGLLEGLDVLATPTTSVPAPRLEDVIGKESGRLRRLLLRNLEAFNLCGFPALSIRANPGSSRLPTGIQLAGRLRDDWSVLKAGRLAAKAIAGR